MLKTLAFFVGLSKVLLTPKTPYYIQKYFRLPQKTCTKVKVWAYYMGYLVQHSMWNLYKENKTIIFL